MWKVVFWTLFLLLNMLVWYVNVRVLRRRNTSCQGSSSLTTRPPVKILGPLFAKKTLYPETRNISYLLDNPDICGSGRPVSLLYVVSSSLGHFENRKTIRETFANSSYFTHNIVRVAFFVGTTKSTYYQKRLVEEHKRYGDVIQSDFVDAYRNLTRKVVREFHWVATHCKNAEIVAKIDDDVFVDTVLILSKYKHILKTDYEIICNRFYTGIHREGKWAVGENFFRGHRLFPYTYCSGYAVIMKGEIISRLLKAATMSPFIWVDDLYFSGILPYKLGNIRTLHVPNKPSLSSSKCFLNITCNYVFGSLSLRYTRKIWNITVKEKHGKEVLRKV